MLSSGTWRKHRRRPKGVVGLALIALIALISVYALVASLRKSTTDLTIEREAFNRRALLEAKAALIAYAASQAWKAVDKDDQPGALPCPSADENGTAATACSTPISSSADNRIGRFPWKTVGTSDLRDASGELLWYALSNRFRKSSGKTYINSDTQGTLTLYDDQISTSTATQSNVVALIFAPGNALSGQTRSSTAGVSNYLECRNAQLNDTFSISAPPASTTGSCPYSANTPNAGIFNDQMITVTVAELMAVVEPAVVARLERDIKPALQTYYSQWGGFPYPASLTGGPGHPGTTTNNTSSPPTSSNRAQSLYLGDITLTSGRGLLPIDSTVSHAWVAGSGVVTTTGGKVSSAISSTTCATIGSPSGWRCSFTLNGLDAGAGYTTSDTCMDSSGVRYRYCMENPAISVAADVSNVGISIAKISPTTASDVAVTNSTGSTTRTMSGGTITPSLKTNGNGTLTYTGTNVYSSYSNSSPRTRTMRVTIPDRVTVNPVTSTTDADAGWLTNNEWYRQIYYVVSPGHLPGAGNTCSTVTTPRCLTVNGLPSSYSVANDKRAILILTGYALNGLARPSDTLSNYLEGDNATPGGSNGYTYAHMIGSVKTTNDRVVVISP